MIDKQKQLLPTFTKIREDIKNGVLKNLDNAAELEILLSSEIEFSHHLYPKLTLRQALDLIVKYTQIPKNDTQMNPHFYYSELIPKTTEFIGQDKLEDVLFLYLTITTE